MIDMSKKSAETKGRESWDLIGRKLSKKKRESYRKWMNIEDCVAIGKKMVVLPIGGALCAMKRGSLTGCYETNQ